MYRVTSNRSYGHKRVYAVVIPLLFVIFFFFNIYNRYNFTVKDPAPTRRYAYHTDDATEKERNETYTDMKYMLLWTNPKDFPFVYFGEGQQVFTRKHCQWRNCYVTGDRAFLGDYTEFDAVVFNGPQLRDALTNDDLPARRVTSQKYVYANIEAASAYPVCDRTWNGFFNWTWTYRLDSDSVWKYFVIRNMRGEVIGPVMHMHWMESSAMDSVDDELRSKLSTKKKAAAWFVSNCNTESRREVFVGQVQERLRSYDLRVDIFGACGTLQCPKRIMSRCLNMLERDYYFYFAFENALSEDYVTEKILYALNHNTVPVVYGGANYTRFMAPGTYLDARQMGAAALAERMFELMQSPTQYLQMFRWKRYYWYEHTHVRPDADVYCAFCSALNGRSLGHVSVYEQFDSWWTPKTACRKSNS